jgi:hypothetical protein
MFNASSSLSLLAHLKFFICSFTQVFVHYVGHGSHNSTRSGTHTRIDLLNDFMSPMCASVCFKVKFNLFATCSLFTNVHVPLYGYKRRRKGAKEKSLTRKFNVFIEIIEDPEETIPTIKWTTTTIDSSAKKVKKYAKGKKPIMEAPKDVKLPIYIDTYYIAIIDGSHTYSELFHLVKYIKGL